MQLLCIQEEWGWRWFVWPEGAHFLFFKIINAFVYNALINYKYNAFGEERSASLELYYENIFWFLKSIAVACV